HLHGGDRKWMAERDELMRTLGCEDARHSGHAQRVALGESRIPEGLDRFGLHPDEALRGRLPSCLGLVPDVDHPRRATLVHVRQPVPRSHRRSAYVVWFVPFSLTMG